MQKARAVFLTALVVLAVVGTGGTAAGAGLTGVDHPSANSPSTTDASDTCEFPVTVTDATGTEITLDEQPDRITTTNPSAAQTLWELGAQDRVVGVTQFATYLDGAEDKTNVSANFGVSVERVVATDPDLVLAPNASAGQVEDLRNAGLTVYHFPEATDIDDIAAKTERTGRLVGSCDSAADINTEMNETVEDVKDRTADIDRPEALYPLGGGFVAGDETFINEIMEVGGTTNVAAAEDDDYPQLSDEVILETDPELLIVTSPNAAILDEQPYASTTAGAEENYVVMDRNYLNQPAPRSVIESTETLAAGVEEFQAENTCEFPVTVTDATGTEVTLDEQPDRITTTNPSAAQTLWELGAQDRVVGVTQFATYLDGAADKTNVSSDGIGVSVERVVATDPDLVLAPNASAGQVKDLRNAGLTVYHFPEATDIDDIAAKTERTGRLVGNCEAASEVNTEMNETVADVKDRTADLNRPDALYPLGGGFVAGDETFINEIMEIGGTTNVAAAEDNDYPQLSDEVILETNPELLIVTSPDPAILNEQPYASTTAGIERNYVVMDVNYLNQPAPRSVIESTETLATEVEDLQADDQTSSAGGGGGGGGSTADETTEETVSAENVSEPNATDENQTVTTTTDENTTTTDEETDTASESTDETDQDATSTDSSGSTDDSASTDTNDPSAESTNTTAEETQTDTPGFGVVVALVALLAGALVARRR